MADSTLNRFVSSGTTAERTAFTPTPPTPASGPDQGYLWWDTDLQEEFAYDFGLADWVSTAGGGGGGITELTGDVTAGPGSGAQAATIANNAVSNAKLADMNALTVKSRVANSSGDPSDLALSDGETAKRVGTSLVSAGYGPVNIEVLTSGTAATYTVPAGVYRLLVVAQGPGGGGGGADGGSSNAGVGAGGSSGGYCEKIFSVIPGATFTYTIGTGGAGGIAGNNSGSSGSGPTLFDEAGTPMSAGAGGGGGSMAAGTSFNQAGGSAGGVATGGTINIDGGIGIRGIRYSGTQAVGGIGCNSKLGFGGVGGFNSDGQAAVEFGAGGGGGLSTNTTDRAGGDGGPGVIFVYEFN